MVRIFRLQRSWIPAMEGVDEKLMRGAKVANVGGGKGASSTLMAKAFPSLQIFGSSPLPMTIVRTA